MDLNGADLKFQAQYQAKCNLPSLDGHHRTGNNLTTKFCGLLYYESIGIHPNKPQEVEKLKRGLSLSGLPFSLHKRQMNNVC